MPLRQRWGDHYHNARKDLSARWRSGKHARAAETRAIESAPRPARGPRRRKWGTIHRREKSLHGHRRPTRISNQRIDVGVPPQRHTPRCHPRRSARTITSLAKRQRDDKRWNRSPNIRGGKASARRSSGTRVL